MWPVRLGPPDAVEDAVRALLVAGGSGGHLVPALALAEDLRGGRDECWMMSTRRPVDEIMASGMEGSWNLVDLQRFTPLWRWLNPVFVSGQVRSMGQIGRFLGQIQPDVVVGFGGYLSAVTLMAARARGIPTVVHEQNVLPGRANRWLARWSDAVAVSFSQTLTHLPRNARVRLTGNPIRAKPEGWTRQKACALFGFDPARPVVLVMGGSQGSRAVNRLVLEVWEGIPDGEREGLQILHLAGQAGFEEVRSRYRDLGMMVKIFPFLKEMPAALSAATLAISRAGATAICEMTAFGVPALLIPYPYAGAHQTANAQWMSSAGGAVVLEQSQTGPEELWRELQGLLADEERRERMRESLQAHADGSAADRLGAFVKEVASGTLHFGTHWKECPKVERPPL